MFGNKFGAHEKVECGLVRICEIKDEYRNETFPIPLISVQIEAAVIHAVAQVEVTQVYVNKEESPIEAIYYFPVDSNGGITHFHAEIEGRKITGVAKEHEEAKEQYENAVKQNQTAFLVEQSKPDIFKVRVGMLKPGSQAKIVIGYITEVKNEDNAIRFFIPTTVAPRYIPPTETDEKSKDLKNMTYSETSPAPLSLKINVSVQGEIKKIESPTHQIKIESKGAIPEKKNWNKALVQLETTTTDMDRDFVLLIHPVEKHIARLYKEKSEDSTTIMNHFIPSFKLDEQPVELIFVLDRSGSMIGPSIELAKKALNLFLHSLPADCYFNIVGFGSTYQFLFPESVKYDDESLKKAKAHAKDLCADLGGTEILQPLKALFNSKPIPGYLRQLFTITDGEVSNTDQVIGLTKLNSHTTRVFSLGIGDSASHHLVEGIAEAGYGSSAFVTYNESIDAKVLKQLKNALQPALSNVKIEWTGFEAIMKDEKTQPTESEINKEKTLMGYGKPKVDDASLPTDVDNTSILNKKYFQAPDQIPPIFDGSQMVFFGVFKTVEEPKGVKIMADSPDGALSLEIPNTEENDVGSTGMLHKLAAIKIIRELELKIASQTYDYSSELNPSIDPLKKKIIEIAVKYGLASKYTSFVAVDETSKKEEKDNWVMQSRYVPSQFAHGWHGGRSARSAMMPCAMPMAYCAPMNKARKGLSMTSKFAGGGSSSNSLGSAPLSGFSFGSSQSSHLDRGSFVCGSSSAGQANNMESDDMDVDQREWEQMEEASPPMVARKSVAPCGLLDGTLPPRDIEGNSPHPHPDDTNGRSKRPPPVLTPEDRLDVLIACQSFEGSFNLDEQFAKSIEVDFQKIKKEAESKKINEKVWATALALAYMSEKLSTLKDSWELVYKKANKWLTTNSNANDLETIKLAAIELLK